MGSREEPLNSLARGLSWRCSGEGSVPPVQRALIQSLVGELRSHMLQNVAKKVKNNKSNNRNSKQLLLAMSQAKFETNG